jgi:hypothetical protein
LWLNNHKNHKIHKNSKNKRLTLRINGSIKIKKKLILIWTNNSNSINTTRTAIMTTISKKECEKMWGNLTDFQKKELMVLFAEQQEKKQKYELCDDVWRLIKEYAGIYNITTEWDKVNKVSSAKLYEWYRTNTKYRISHLSKSNAKEQKRIILKFFYKKQRSEKMMRNLYYLITPHLECDEITTKPIKEKKDFTNYRVGQEIIYQIPFCNYKCGVIRKINKASINVDFYDEIEEIVSDGLRTIGRDFIFKKDTFSSNKTIRTNFKSDDELRHFEKHKLNRRAVRHDFSM